MKFHSSDLAEAARDLRKSGSSFVKIAEKLRINEKVVARWCYDVPSQSKSHLRAKQRREKLTNEAVAGNQFEITPSTARILAATIYWAEGGKYPQTSAVSFCNSDPELVLFFARLIRIGFNLDESKFRVHLQIHSNQNQQETFTFWSKLLDVPENRFWKPTITSPTNRMKRLDYKGTCTLRYHDCDLLLIITGIYKNLTNGKVAEWPKAAHC